MKRIDLHIHTKATNFDGEFSFDVEVLKAYVEKAGISAVAITNHNVFDADTYHLAVNELDIPVFPGIEINVTTPGKYGHVLVIAREEDLSEFANGASRIETLFDSGRQHIAWTEVRRCFPLIENWLVIPHYRKKKHIDEVTLCEIRQTTGIDALEVGNAKKWLKECETAPEPLVLFSDSRPGATACDNDSEVSGHRYAYGFTYIRCEEMSVGAIKAALRDKKNVGVFDEANEFEILPERLPVSKRLNVLIGKRSSGKTYTLKRIMDSLDPQDYEYVKQFQITANADEKRFEENNAKEDERFFSEYFEPMSHALAEYLSAAGSSRVDVGNYCEAVVTFAMSPESDCSSYPIYTTQAFSTDKLDNRIESDFELIRASRTIRNDEERRAIVQSELGLESLAAFERAIELAAWEEFVRKMKLNAADKLRRSIQFGLAQFSSRKPLPEIEPLRSYLKESYREKQLAAVVESLRNEQGLDDEPEGCFKRKRIRIGVPNASEARKAAGGSVPKGADLKSLFAKEVVDVERIRALAALPSEMWPLATKLLFRIDSRIVNNDPNETPLSGGQRAEYVFLHAIRQARGSDYVFIDEPESSFDNEFLAGEVSDLISKLANESTVFLVTHNNALGVSLHPDKVIYAVKEADKYRLYSGDLSSSVLRSIDGTTERKSEVLLRTMEAGRDAYEDRRGYYEIA